MRKFEIATPYGDRYFIHDNGDIERADGRNLPLSGQWKFCGLVSTHPFSRGFLQGWKWLEDLADGELPTLYKNGNPRYTVADLDHGTTRTWGNTKVHGIRSVRRVE